MHLKQTLAAELKLPGTVGAAWHLFGFRRRRVPTGPGDFPRRPTVSLLGLLRGIAGDHVNLNVFRVGADQFTDADHHRADFALFRVREVFDAAGLRMGRLAHYDIATADADGLDAPTSTADLIRLSRKWRGYKDAIDVFFPRAMSVTVTIDGKTYSALGRSAIDGPCDGKVVGDDMSGAVCGLWWSFDETARTFAHEVGHYLGLEHNHGDDCPTSSAAQDNLMAQSRCASSIRDSVDLTRAQGRTARSHCAVR